MKKTIKILILLTFFYSCSDKNDFKNTEELFITKIDSLQRIKHWENLINGEENKPINIYLKNNEGEKLYELKISDLETYTESWVELMNIKNLKNIKRIIKITSDYTACCSNVYSNYLLQTKNKELIELPETEYLHCDGLTPIVEYRFPNQKFGIKNKILLTESFFNEEYEVDSILIKKIYKWNGKKIILEN
jgi:hypothetical protein